MLSSRTGLCGSKPVELSAKSAAQLARLPLDGLKCSQRIALMLPAKEFDYAVLDINLGRGRLGSILPQANTHTTGDRRGACVPDPPAVVQLDPYPLLPCQGRCARCRQHVLPPEGWQRISLFAFTSDQAH